MTFTKSSQQLIREFKEHQQGIARDKYTEISREVALGRAHPAIAVGALRAFEALGYDPTGLKEERADGR